MTRTVAALLLALAAVALALPGELAPWAAQVRGALRTSWPAVPLLVSLFFVLAGRWLPQPTLSPARGRDHTGLTVGLLLLLEPVLHLAVLAVCARVANPMGAEALLPTGWTPPVAGAASLARLAVFCVVTPVCEEFFFRGRLLPWLRGHLGAVSAVSISALTFAVAHGDLVQVAVALPVGLLLGTMRLCGAGLGACMLAHGVHNALFVVAGPALVGLPIAAPLLAAGGLLLAVLAWFYHLRPTAKQLRHALFVAGFGAALIIGLTPLHRKLTDRWWVAGVHRLCVYWRVPNEQLLARVLAQERTRRLTDLRRSLLVVALVEKPCQTTPRQFALLSLLNPGFTPTGDTWENDAAAILDELASAAPPTLANAELARRMGRRFPTAFADALLEYPEVLRRWLPLPERSLEAAAQLQRTNDQRDRRILLGALERACPGCVAEVIHRLPADAVTPLDRRHLRLHYPDEAE